MRYVHFDPARVKRRGKQKLVKSGDTCLWCHAKLLPGQRTWEHLKPRALGGKDRAENLAVACAPCNLDRSKVTGDCLNQRRLSVSVESALSMTVPELTRLLVALHRLRRRISHERDHYAKWVAIEIRALGYAPSAVCRPLTEQAVECLLSRAHTAFAHAR